LPRFLRRGRKGRKGLASTLPKNIVGEEKRTLE
jgi:hypothetical protein